MKKHTCLLASLALAPIMVPSALAEPTPVQHLTILHTTDLHGQLEPHLEYEWPNGPQAAPRAWRAGGLAHLKTLFDNIRAEQPGRTLIVDTGDTFQGSAIAALSEGKAIPPLMNMLGYDVMLPGNWEVVYGPNALISLMKQYEAPTVTSNMFEEKSGKPVFPPYVVKTVNGVRIGILGYTDHFVKTRQSPAYSEGLRYTEPVATVEADVKRLREQERVDVVLALGHLGLAQQVWLADQPAARGIDFLLGGDTHERVRTPVPMRHTQVTEPGAFGSYVGRLDLEVKDGRVVSSSYQLVPVEADKLPADPQVAAAIEQAKAPYRKRMSQVLGRLAAPVARYSVIESPFDNMVADAVREATGVDFAVSNGFRFGAPKPAGDFTYADLYDYLPVDSQLKTGEVTGTQVRDWLEAELENVFAVDATKRFGGWLVRPSGLTFTFDSRKPKGQRLLEVNIGGKPLAADRTYTMAACEREGDAPDTLCRLRGAKATRVHQTTIHQAMAAYFQKHSPITPRLEQRAKAVDLPSVLRTQGGAPGYDFW